MKVLRTCANCVRKAGCFSLLTWHYRVRLVCLRGAKWCRMQQLSAGTCFEIWTRFLGGCVVAIVCIGPLWLRSLFAVKLSQGYRSGYLHGCSWTFRHTTRTHRCLQRNLLRSLYYKYSRWRPGMRNSWGGNMRRIYPSHAMVKSYVWW